jgi:hypothetical protein
MGYEVGRVYIWQNQVGDWAYLNGTETTVIGPRVAYTSVKDGSKQWGWPVDRPIHSKGWQAYALLGDLRPKNPPPGEQKIIDLFKLSELV